MGVLYLVFAVFVFTTRQFGTIQLDPMIVYALSGLLTVYGAFRMYRAIVAFRNR
ncbi:MAG: C4-dicarboxylate ABC transporter [Chitinophagia bacterium]|nr:C4-dicarboxylate ABC transporter [Chitinophagia bacterium]